RLARRQADDVEPWLDCSDPRRGYFLRDPLRAEQGTVEPNALRPAGVERALRQGQGAARRRGARRALPRDGSPVLRLRAATADHAPDHHWTCASLGRWLPAAPGDARVLEVSGYR